MEKNEFGPARKQALGFEQHCGSKSVCKKAADSADGRNNGRLSLVVAETVRKGVSDAGP